MTSLIKRLVNAPQSFEFFQAVRLLEVWTQQAVTFKQQPSLQFAGSDIATIHLTETKAAEIYVNFMGLTSPQGLLPAHYTEQVLQLLQVKNPAFAEFLQWLQQRSLTFFYQAWRKHHALQTEPAVTQLLQGLVGCGLTAQQNNLPANFYVYYASHFIKQQPTASSLVQLLSDYFAIAVVLKPLQGEWLTLDHEQVTRLLSSDGQHSRLGVDMAVGNRVWQCQHKFTLRIGPLDQMQLTQFLPNGHAFSVLKQLIRRFIGPQLQFALQLVVKADCVPAWQLNSATGLQLGWSTWLNSRLRQVDVEDIILQEKTYELSNLGQ